MKFGMDYGTRDAILAASNKDAAYRQTPVEHQEVLDQFQSPNMTPIEKMLAAEQGIEAEQALPKYWDDDMPRRDLGTASHWIDEVEYFPDLGIASMSVNGKQYIYPLTNDEMGNWMTADSIGSWYNNLIKRK